MPYPTTPQKYFVGWIVRWFIGNGKTKVNIRPIGTGSAIDRSALVIMVDVAKVEVIMVGEFCFDSSFCGLKIGERTVKHSNYNSQ